MAAHFVEGRGAAEARGVLVPAVAAPCVEGLGDEGNLLAGQFAVGAIDHMAEIAGVDEQDFAALASARKEPQADGDLRAVEQLPRQGDHALDQIRFDQLLADRHFGGGAGGHGAVGEHESRHAAGREMVNDVLHPGEVRVAARRRAEAPARVVGEALAAPSRRR